MLIFTDSQSTTIFRPVAHNNIFESFRIIKTKNGIKIVSHTLKIKIHSYKKNYNPPVKSELKNV